MVHTHTGTIREHPVGEGHQFMISLLINSLMEDCSIENALISAITMESQGQATPTASSKAEQAIPLLHLVHQLISNSTSKQLTYFKQVHVWSVHLASLNTSISPGIFMGLNFS